MNEITEAFAKEVHVFTRAVDMREWSDITVEAMLQVALKNANKKVAHEKSEKIADLEHEIAAIRDGQP